MFYVHPSMEEWSLAKYLEVKLINQWLWWLGRSLFNAHYYLSLLNVHQIYNVYNSLFAKVFKREN